MVDSFLIQVRFCCWGWSAEEGGSFPFLCTLYFMSTLSPTSQMAAELKDRLEHLRTQLKQLGETI